MKKFLFVAVCCLLFCGCGNKEETNQTDDNAAKLEEEKRMCCMNYGGVMSSGSCEGVTNYEKYQSCIDNIDIDD